MSGRDTDELENRRGFCSYIRLGRARSSSTLSSSPTTDHPTGNYVWDFLNWGYTSPFALERFSQVKPEGTEIVPYTSMDQGRLFVRVSIQDLSTLQLTCQKGLEALRKAKSKIDLLTDENNRLQALVKSWSIKTTALTTETIELRQELSNLMQKMRKSSVSIEEHDGFIGLLCQKICLLQSKNYSPLCMTLDDLEKTTNLLPPLVRSTLTERCPQYQKFVISTQKENITHTRANYSKEGVATILETLPIEAEADVIQQIIQNFEKKHGISFRAFSSKRKDSEEVMQPPLKTCSSRSNTSTTNSYEISDSQPHKILLGYLKAADDVHLPVQVNTCSASRQSLASKHHTCSTSNQSLASKHHTCTTSKQSLASKHHNESENSSSMSIGVPIAQSTPHGTITRFVIPKPAPTTQPRRKHKMKKKARWNFAARFCLRPKSTTSDSESLDTSINFQIKPK